MSDNDQKRIALANILKDIHKRIPKQDINTLSIGDYEIRKGYTGGKKITRLIIYMRSSGCKWMIDEKFGGCFMCGHLAGTTQGIKVSVNDYINQFDNIISSIKFSEIPMLCVYNAGSFFNNSEVPLEARQYIYKKINSINEIKHVIFESRPEFIIDDELKRLRDLIPDKKIEIGIGLESSDEYVRQVCLNKGFSLNDFLNAMEIIKNNHISVLSYILLKPPFLTEKLAIENSINSIKWAFSKGVDVISLEPVSVQKYTLIHLLYNMNLFRPPWIWSVLEVIKNTHNNGLIRIGGFEFFPPPAVCTHNCSTCNEICIDAIENYNATNDINFINETLKINCKTCKNDWLNSLNDINTIDDNIDLFLKEYEKIDIDNFLRNDFRHYPNNLLRMGICSSINL